MHIHKTGPNYIEWCKQEGVDPRGMEMHLSEALFASLLRFKKPSGVVGGSDKENASESKLSTKKGK